MRKFARAIFTAALVGVCAALFAAVCGCSDGHEHDWSGGYKIVEGTQTHAKICSICGKPKDEHTAVWSSNSDTTCDYEDCTITRTVSPLGAITVTAPSDSVAKGGTIQLTASESGVTWSVPGGMVGVSISGSGLLTVTAAATASSVTVTASKTGYTSGTKRITVTEPVPPPEYNRVFEAGIYADEVFNLLEIKRNGTVGFGGEDYTVGKIEDDGAALTSALHTGYISKTEIDGNAVYAVEIAGVVSGNFTSFPDFELKLSDFVGTYKSADGIVVNVGEIYYKCNSVSFYAVGTVIVRCVEVKDAGGEVKPGASEVAFPLMAPSVEIIHNIINFGGDWRIVALDGNADGVAVVHFGDDGESVTRRDYTRDNGNSGDNINVTDNSGGDSGVDGRDYEEMTGGRLTFEFSSAESKFIKCAITVTGEYVLSCECDDYLGEGGVAFTVGGVAYGHIYDGRNWTVAEGGTVFRGILRDGYVVKAEVFCSAAAFGASLGGVTVRIETGEEYERRKAPPVFGQEQSGVYYGAYGGNIIEITIGGNGITYNGDPLVFIGKENGKLNYRAGEKYITFVLGQGGVISVTDRIISAEYTAYKKVEWQGFDADKRGAYSFLDDIRLSDGAVNLSIELTVDGEIFEHRLMLSDGDDNLSRPVLIGLNRGVYTFMDGYGKKITFRFGDNKILVLSDDIQPFVGTYTAVKENKPNDYPTVAIGKDNIIEQSGEYILYSEKECTLAITFDENKLSVLIANVAKHSGDYIAVSADSPLVFNFVLVKGVESAVFRAALITGGEDEKVNIVGDWEELCVGDNAIVFDYADYIIFLNAGGKVSAGTYKLTFINVKYVTVNRDSVPVDENFTAEITVELSDGDCAEIYLSYQDFGFPVKVIVEKLG